MDPLTLVIGTRNYSSWSLRPWLLLRHLGLPFSERQFHLDTPEFHAEVPKFSPTRQVPVLMHGERGPWLFGAFSTADAMYAPVVLRARSYSLPLSELATRYLETMLADEHLGDWIAAARRETIVIPQEEVGAGA